MVPAGKAKDLGLDKSMVISYGQDDRVCAFAGVKAIFETENPEYTAVTLCARQRRNRFIMVIQECTLDSLKIL